METIRELFVKLGLDWESSGFASAQLAVDLLEKGLQLAVDAVNKLSDTLVEATVSTAAYGEEVEVLGQKTGFATDAIQKWSYAAQLSHSSAEELRSGLGLLARQVEKAKDGGEEAQEAFSKLGISMQFVRTASPEALLNKIADRMKELGPGSKRTALAMDLFGRSGANLIPMLDRGSEGLKKMGLEAEDLNIIMSEDAVHAASAFKENLEKLEATADGLKHVIGGVLIEALGPLLEDLLAWVKANRDLIRTRLERWVGYIAAGLKLAAKGVRAVVNGISGFIAILKTLLVFVGAFIVAQQLMNVGLASTLVNFALNSAAAVAYGAVLVATAAKAALAWLAAAAPVLLLTAALTLAVLAAEDLYVFLNGGRSVIGTLGIQWSKFIEEFSRPKIGDNWFVAGLRAALHWIMNLEQVWDRISKGAVKFYDFFAYGGSEAKATRKGGAWETNDDAVALERARAVIRGIDEQNRMASRGVLADRGAGNAVDYAGAAPWRVTTSGGGSMMSNNIPINVFVPPGTPPAMVGQATKDGVQEALTDVLRDAAAATSK